MNELLISKPNSRLCEIFLYWTTLYIVIEFFLFPSVQAILKHPVYLIRAIAWLNFWRSLEIESMHFHAVLAGSACMNVCALEIGRFATAPTLSQDQLTGVTDPSAYYTNLSNLYCRPPLISFRFIFDLLVDGTTKIRCDRRISGVRVRFMLIGAKEI